MFSDVQKPRPLPVLVLADVSGSMGQPIEKIDALNRAVAEMIRKFADEDSIHGEITVGIITFGGEGANLHHPVGPATRARWADMAAGGRTWLGQAFDLARELLEDETVVPKRAYRPTIILVSDGVPTDGWEEPLERLLASPRGGKAIRLAVAVGPEAGTSAYHVLEAFVDNPAVPVIRADELDRLTLFFQWVTMSVSTRAQSARPDAPSTFDADDLYDLID
ncbi:vWA domain-containing protein [Streptosporangium canum]